MGKRVDFARLLKIEREKNNREQSAEDLIIIIFSIEREMKTQVKKPILKKGEELKESYTKKLIKSPPSLHINFRSQDKEWNTREMPGASRTEEMKKEGGDQGPPTKENGMKTIEEDSEENLSHLQDKENMKKIEEEGHQNIGKQKRVHQDVDINPTT